MSINNNFYSVVNSLVAQGAGNAAVRLELVNAVSALLGLGTDKISVVKMK